MAKIKLRRCASFTSTKFCGTVTNNKNHGYVHLVSNFNQTLMGATELDFWAGVDSVVRNHRRHIRHNDIKNVYLVGGGTHPGSGLPTILESGRIAAELIK
jgi:phytoene dehydrogenase-like protein